MEKPAAFSKKDAVLWKYSSVIGGVIFGFSLPQDAAIVLPGTQTIRSAVLGEYPLMNLIANSIAKGSLQVSFSQNGKPISLSGLLESTAILPHVRVHYSMPDKGGVIHTCTGEIDSETAEAIVKRIINIVPVKVVGQGPLKPDDIKQICHGLRRVVNLRVASSERDVVDFIQAVQNAEIKPEQVTYRYEGTLGKPPKGKEV